MIVQLANLMNQQYDKGVGVTQRKQQDSEVQLKKAQGELIQMQRQLMSVIDDHNLTRQVMRTLVN